MTKQAAQDQPPISGDPVLLNVLATAQRFAAWYAEYLSAGSMTEAGAGADERRTDELVRNLQHAVFDLMAAVHEMNRHCAAATAEPGSPKVRHLALARVAVH